MKKILFLCFLFTALVVPAQTVKLNINACRVLYNPFYHKAYVAVESLDPVYPQMILQIDPISGAVEKQISLPNNPQIIRQSADQQYLYVSYQWKPDIMKINLQDFTIVATIGTEGMDVVDMAVMPANANTLIVIRGHGEYPDDMVMYKNGIKQARKLNLTYSSFSALCIKNDGSKLYMHNRISTGYEGQLVNIYDDGVEAVGKIWDYMITGFSFIKNNNNLIYNESGKVLEVFNDSIPKIIGRMPTGRISDYGRAGYEYSPIHQCYVFGHTYDYKGYISFFHGKHYNYQGSYLLSGQLEIIYDMAIVDQNHFILVGLKYSGENKCLLLYAAESKNKVFLQSRPAEAEQNSKQGHRWGVSSGKDRGL
ncbi:MAG: hypothetical protein WCI48_16480 [Bacteroidota bacterium]